MAEELTAEQVAQATADKAAADKAAADLAATDPEALRKQIAILNSENAAKRIRAKELEDLIAERDAADAAANEKAALERGEHLSLYEKEKAEREALSAQMAVKDAALQKFFDAELAQVPEEKRVLLDHISGVEAKLEFIAVLKAAKVFEPAKGPDLRESGEFKSGTLEAKLEEAKKAGNLSAQISIKKQIFDKQHPN